MNKYSLIFDKRRNERKYQKYRLIPTIQRFRQVTMIGILLTFIKLILLAQNLDLVGVIVLSISIVFQITIYVYIPKFIPQRIDYGFTILNHLLMIIQYFVTYEDAQDAYLYGSILTSLHVIYLIYSDFRFQIVTIFNFCIVRLIIAFVNRKFDGLCISFTIVTSFALLTALYDLSVWKRQLFQYSSQEKHWHRVLPKLISNPFILFHYSKDIMNFKVKCCSNLINFPGYDDSVRKTENLRHFLKNYYIKSQSLEDYYFTRLKQYDKSRSILRSCTEQISPSNFQDSRMELSATLSEMNLGDINFLIVLDFNTHKINTLCQQTEQMKQIINQHQAIVNKFLEKQLRFIQVALVQDTNRFQYLMRMKIHHLYFTGKYRISNSFNLKLETTVTTFEFKNIFINLLNMFRKAYQYLEFIIEFQSDGDFEITHNLQLVNDFLIQLFQVIARNSDGQTSILFHIDVVEELLYIKLQALNFMHIFDDLNKNCLIKLFLEKLSSNSQIFNIDNWLCVSLYRSQKSIGQLITYQSSQVQPHNWMANKFQSKTMTNVEYLQQV